MSELDDAVTAAQGALEAHLATMEARRQSFLLSMDEWLSVELPKACEAAARDLYEHTLELGSEGIADLKTDISDAVDGVSELVEKALGGTALWTHLRNAERYRSGSPSTGDYFVGQRGSFPDQFGKAVGEILDEFTKILVKHGYRTVHGGARLLRLPEPSSAVIENIKEYDRLDKQLTKVWSDLHKATDAVGQARAGDLWNQA